MPVVGDILRLHVQMKTGGVHSLIERIILCVISCDHEESGRKRKKKFKVIVLEVLVEEQMVHLQEKAVKSFFHRRHDMASICDWSSSRSTLSLLDR